MKKDIKKSKFNFEELKATATSPNPSIRKKGFEEYFERFEEFPSFLFDNSNGIDALLLQTIKDLKNDPMSSEKMQKGIATLLERLPPVVGVI